MITVRSLIMECFCCVYLSDLVYCTELRIQRKRCFKKRRLCLVGVLGIRDAMFYFLTTFVDISCAMVSDKKKQLPKEKVLYVIRNHDLVQLLARLSVKLSGVVEMLLHLPFPVEANF